VSAILWTAGEAANATGGQAIRNWEATGISIDSRTVKPGDLFVALAGPSYDGHDFIAAALAKGAVAAMAHRRPAAVSADAPLLMVDDTLKALTRLGLAGRARSQARFVGVTGSVGKTGTKEALRLAFSTQAETFANAGSLNNHWGVPLSLARLPQSVAIGIFEVGMNHAGELGPLSRMVRPEIAVITTVEAAHLEFFDSVEAIADAKAEIFEGVDPSGVAILNRDNAQFDRLALDAKARGIKRIVGFGEHAEAEARLIECQIEPEGSSVKADILGRRLDYRLAAPGRHWVQNSLAVLATVAVMGLDLGLAAGALGSFAAPKGRGQRRTLGLPGGSFELIDESYNASPAAMRAAFAVLGKTRIGAGGRRIAVLGDMRELGKTAGKLHAGLARPLIDAGIDLVLACGPLMAELQSALPREKRGGYAADSQGLVAAVIAAVKPGDVVLVKGSLGTRMAPIVEALLDLDRAAQPTARAANGH
jgi:UDP-N-acetylmuramoyl-tripeptide--D-alanyl-D-alanine ligase